MLDWVEANAQAGSPGESSASERSLSRSIASARRGRAMAYFSAEGHLIEANAAFLALYGYAMGDIKGAHQRLFAAPKSKGERRLAALWRELSVGVAQHGEFDRIDSDGRVFAVLERLEPLKCARTGKTTGVLSTAWPSRQTEEIRAGARRASFESEGAACV